MATSSQLQVGCEWPLMFIHNEKNLSMKQVVNPRQKSKVAPLLMRIYNTTMGNKILSYENNVACLDQKIYTYVIFKL